MAEFCKVDKVDRVGQSIFTHLDQKGKPEQFVQGTRGSLVDLASPHAPNPRQAAAGLSGANCGSR